MLLAISRPNDPDRPDKHPDQAIPALWNRHYRLLLQLVESVSLGADPDVAFVVFQKMGE